MSATANGQIIQSRFRLWSYRFNGPARKDVQSELAQTDRYVHSAEGIQKSGSEFNFEGFPLCVRCAVQCRFHKYLLKYPCLEFVSSCRLFQSVSEISL